MQALRIAGAQLRDDRPVVAARAVVRADHAESDDLPVGGGHDVVDRGAEQLREDRRPGADRGVAGGAGGVVAAAQVAASAPRPV